MKQLTDFDIGYLAGVIDGEGSLAIEKLSPRKNRKYCYFTPRLVVVNTNKQLMDWLVNKIGGKYHARKLIVGRKQCYSWFIFGKLIEKVIKLIIPLLICKRQLAELILQFRETVGKTGWHVTEEVLQLRNSMYLKSRELNKLG